MDPIFVCDLADRLRSKGHSADVQGDRVMVKGPVNFVVRQDRKQFLIESELRCNIGTPVSRDEIKTKLTNAEGIAEAVDKFLRWSKQ